MVKLRQSRRKANCLFHC